MNKVNDTVAIGALAGIVGSIPAMIVDFISVQMGISKWYGVQIAGSIYLYEHLTGQFSGILLGLTVWFSMAIFLGILTVFIFKITGTDYWWLKGYIVSNFVMFIVIYGFLFNLGGAKIVPFDIGTNVTVFAENIVFGVTMGYSIIRWGDEASIQP